MAQPKGKGSSASQQRGKELGITSAGTENKTEEMLSVVPAKIRLLPCLWVFYMNTGTLKHHLCRKKFVSYLGSCAMAPLMGQPICLSLMQLI